MATLCFCVFFGEVGVTRTGYIICWAWGKMQHRAPCAENLKTVTAELEPKHRALWGCLGPLLKKLAQGVIILTSQIILKGKVTNIEPLTVPGLQ